MSEQAEREALAARIGATSEPAHVCMDVASESIVEMIERSDEIAHKTLDGITESLAELRRKRTAIDERIRSLVEAEQIWTPIVKRLDNGIVRKT